MNFLVKYEFFGKVWKSLSTNISVKYEFFGKVRNSYFTKEIRTFPKNSYFMIFILYHKIRTSLKYSYFTENFVLYQKIRTPDEQVPNQILSKKVEFKSPQFCKLWV